MCCGEKQGHPVMPLHGGGAEFGASRMCGCEDEHGLLSCPMASIISVPMEYVVGRDASSTARKNE